MKFLSILIVALGFVVSGGMAEARDTRYMLNYKDALETTDAKAKLNPDIKFYFGSKTAPAIEKDMGEFTSNKKTNAFNKDDQAACYRAWLSAMLSLRDRARQLGGNAVINIKSFYKSDLKDDANQFECGAGALMAGVALKGTVVKLK